MITNILCYALGVLTVALYLFFKFIFTEPHRVSLKDIPVIPYNVPSQMDFHTVTDSIARQVLMNRERKQDVQLTLPVAYFYVLYDKLSSGFSLKVDQETEENVLYWPHMQVYITLDKRKYT